VFKAAPSSSAVPSEAIGTRRVKWLLAFALTGVALLFVASRAQAAVYWTNSASGSIGIAENDGTEVDQEFIIGLDQPSAVAVDAGHVYWTDGNGNIGRAAVDGSEVEPEFIPGVEAFGGLAVYEGNLYWTEPGEDQIGRATVGGGDIEPEFMTGMPNPSALVVDATGIYWTEPIEIGEEEFEGRIGMAPLAGGAPTTLGGDMAEVPPGLAHNGEGFFWSESAFGTIASSNPEVTSFSNAYIENVDGPAAVTVDPEYLYWTSLGNNSIGRLELGAEDPEAEAEMEFIGGAHNPRGLAVTAEPIVAATPSLILSATPTAVVGETIEGAVELSGGNRPVGLVTLALFEATGAEACGTVVELTSAVETDGDVQLLEYETSEPGTYSWVAIYEGDSRNEEVATECEPLSVVREAETGGGGSGGGGGTTTPAVTTPAPTIAMPAPTGVPRLVRVFGRNKAHGTGVASFWVPGAGTLTVSGKGVKTASVKITAAGLTKLRLTPKGSFLAQLVAHRRGFTKLRVVFHPATGGAVLASTRRVRLIKR
jgi:virginiamycin B lyase